jgi:hypothetical protein
MLDGDSAASPLPPSEHLDGKRSYSARFKSKLSFTFLHFLFFLSLVISSSVNYGMRFNAPLQAWRVLPPLTDHINPLLYHIILPCFLPFLHAYLPPAPGLSSHHPLLHRTLFNAVITPLMTVDTTVLQL